jgi:putative ABC transport system permease protein
MFQHNFRMILKSFRRFRSSFIINLTGLSVGLACALFIYLWVNDELEFDKFHRNESRLYQVLERQQVDGGINVKYRTAGLVAQTLKQTMPEVEYATSVLPSTWFPKFILSPNENKKIKAVGEFASNDYFNVFSFGVTQGDRNELLSNKNSIVISDELAMRLFNTTENVVGKTILVQLPPLERQLTVTGVFTRVPANSSEKFDFVLPFEWFKEINSAVLNWGNDGTNTYVVVKEGTNVPSLNDKISGLIKSNTESQNRTLFLKRYSDVYLYSKYENGVQTGGRIEYVRLFSVIAIFILVIACINFMNLSTATAMKRVKEVGVRKAVGASRQSLVFQYMGEAMLMSFLALLIAVLIVVLLLPQFNQITGKSLALSLSGKLVLILLGISVLSGMISGSYPALYLSRFNPVSVLKGKVSSSFAEVRARKALVVLQFAISVILIVGVMVVYKQVQYIQSKNLGYDKDHIIYFEVDGNLTQNLGPFLSRMKNIPGVTGASDMWGNIVGGYSATGDIEWEGKSPTEKTSFEIMGVDYGLLEMLNIKMAAGRSFSREFPTDTTKIIFNETAIKTMGLKDPIGKKVRLWDEQLEILGVAKDFHFQSLHENIKPLFIRLQPKNASIVMAKIDPRKEREAVDDVEKLYETYNPGYTFDVRFLDEDYQAQYSAEKRVASLSRYFAVFAVLISCLGLFGMAAFTAERRFKEISIRKVLGASEFSIVRLLTGDFTKVVVVAIIIALPIGYFLAKRWLEGFVYKIDLKLWYFAVAGLSALVIAWLTVASLAIKASKANPVNSLRGE